MLSSLRAEGQYYESEVPSSEIAAVEKTRDISAKPLIQSIEVINLFGRYSYQINVPRAKTPRMMLLYGDNGSGKTTILRLLYSLLSPSERTGRGNALADTPFRSFAVNLSNGDTITAEKTQELIGQYEIRVVRKDQLICRQIYPEPTAERHVWHMLNERAFEARDIAEAANAIDVFIESSPEHRGEYVNYLVDLNVAPYYLADDRRIHSQRLEDEGPARGGSRLDAGRPANRRQETSQSLTRELADALRRTNRWLGDQVLAGLGEGTQGNDATYLEVVKRLATQHTPSDERSVSEFKQRMVDLAERTVLFSQFGLVPEFRANLYIAELNKMDHDRLVVAEDVLTPYVDGQQARLDSLEEVQRLIRTFIDAVNGFFTDKAVYYQFPRGLAIITMGEERARLGPSSLSSGELTVAASNVQLTAFARRKLALHH